jgi:hypothetical protein
MMLYAAGSVHDVSVDAECLCGLTWSGELLWFADSARERVVAVDPHAGEVLTVIACPGLRRGLATVGGNLVYSAAPDYRLRIINPDGGDILAEARNPRVGEEITAMEGGREGLWIGYRNMLELRDTTDFGLLASISVRGKVGGATVTDRYLVYSNRAAESVIVVEPATEQEILPISVHGYPTGLTWDGSRIWYCDNAASRLRAIDVPGIVRSL